jgi:uncharacterized protein GlcG (DUF336 family)
MTLTLATAKRMLAAGEAKARELGTKVSIAVVDARGDLVALVRTDGARWTTMDIARGKAVASAHFGQPTAALMERAGRPYFQALTNQEGSRLIFAPGAVPIKEGDQIVGGCGVSGDASGPVDEEVAVAAAAAYRAGRRRLAR